MTSHSLRQGFTLVEILLVLTVMALLFGVLVPHFTASTDDATRAEYETHLTNLRAVVELYRQQHGEYPGAHPASAASCVNGVNEATMAGSPAFLTQLTRYTNVDGEACTGFDTRQFRFGPYLRDGVPPNPLGGSNLVTVVRTGELGLRSGATGGWRFDALTGELIGDH